jgi:hypothetical protein
MQLVINTFGASLLRKGDRFMVRARPNRLAVAAAKVSSILVQLGVIVLIIWMEPALPKSAPLPREDSHAWSQARGRRVD